MLTTIVSQIQERSPSEYNFARKLASSDPRVIVTQPKNAGKMFQQVCIKLVEKEMETGEQADINFTQYKKLESEMRQFHYD